jgi:SAM-dependent methyltransferase
LPAAASTADACGPASSSCASRREIPAPVHAAVSRALALLLAIACASAPAQAPKEASQPTAGQAGKDVIWEPTSAALVEKMLDLAGVTSRDFVMDLGSGDGRIVIAAARRGARALGIEYDPALVALSQRKARAEGVAERARFMKADLFKTDFSQATVITLFLRPTLNLQLRPKLLALKPGTRIVSNTFDMADWKPDQATMLADKADCQSWCKALLWIVPANVAGTYALPQGELQLEQKFQMLAGSLTREGATNPLEGRVRGEALVFYCAGREYRGRMRAGRLELR